jgi:VIT1/CCC1 family predicted Fe2+/Mn2+ transporter
LHFEPVRKATNPEEARGIVADALPPVIAAILEPAELDAMSRRLQELPEPSGHMSFRRSDWLGAIGVFLLVFLSTFPVVIPFIFMQNYRPALAVSNAIAIVMLFLTGYAFGRMTERNPWLVGIAMVFIGAILVAMTEGVGRMRPMRFLHYHFQPDKDLAQVTAK